ncbi:MAG TPA: bacterial transcriptional activator domain-containing protein [Pyrinomonadaceae bacterium]|nr:bacterial transcriptional activator domain-containing protein [Pyrinomonadaceae bacterium]
MKNIRHFIFPFFVVLVLAASTPTAKAQAGEDALAGEGAELCKHAPLAGAAKVFVVVRENDQVLLVGLKGQSVAWKKSFPLREDVNKAKTYVECKGRTIELHSQLPFSAAEVIQTFSWDGLRLKYVSTRHADPSAEFVEEVIRAAETGDTKTLRAFLKSESDGDIGVMYPHAYITRQLFTDAIRRGHNAATRLFKGGRAREAALRLSLMFDVTAKLNRVLGIDEEASKRPDLWLAAWKFHEMQPGEYAYALNDYGYFLQEAGDDEAAVNVFAAVIREDPTRAAAYLNLADSLWKLNRKTEARSHYETYRRLMSAAKRVDQIPVRVSARLS